MFNQIESELGEVQILVNNAGLVSPMLHFFEADETWWRRIIDVNLTGHFLCAHRAARPMARSGEGVIINPAEEVSVAEVMGPNEEDARYHVNLEKWHVWLYVLAVYWLSLIHI